MMNTGHEVGGLKKPSDSARIDITLTEEENASRVMFSVNSDCQLTLTFEEARLLAIRIIMAANRAETRSNLKRNRMSLSPTTETAAKAGWFNQAFAK